MGRSCWGEETMGTAKGHIKDRAYRKLTSAMPGIQLPSVPRTKSADLTLAQQPALPHCCPSSHLSPVWSCPNSCGKILMLLAQEPQPSADQSLRSLLGYLGAAQGSLDLKAAIRHGPETSALQ